MGPGPMDPPSPIGGPQLRRRDHSLFLIHEGQPDWLLSLLLPLLLSEEPIALVASENCSTACSVTAAG